MATTIQADRLMQFTSTVGKDTLVIESLEGKEEISKLFEFQADLLADIDTEIDPKSMIAAKVSVAIALNDRQGTRWINGIIASFEQLAGDLEFNLYRARIVPSMWQLNLSSNCRVFQNLTVVEIVKKVFAEYGLSFSDQTTFSYKPFDYCTQYSETDFDFVSRIMEESGISYWFEHSDQDNKVVLGDSRNAYQDCAVSASIEFSSGDAAPEGAYGAFVSGLTATATMVIGKHAARDFDYRPVKAHDATEQISNSDYGKNGFEHYSYPIGEQGYTKDKDKELTSADFGSLFLESRTLATDTLAEMYKGASNARSLCAGYTFSLDKHPRSTWNRKYLLTSVSHRVDQVPSYRSRSAEGEGYSNEFVAMSSDVLYKPAKTIQKPRIYGPQTALVVAPSGEDMYIDKLGRVCVQFFWDRTRKPNTIDNTWVRVAQSWAGNGWGTYFWPRINDEVVVAFLDGDPDNPVVVGSVYNGVNTPKYPLPDNSTRSGVLTRSSKGGNAKNANELRFEDKAGSEQIFVNAERDMDHRIENDSRRYVGANDSIIVKSDRMEQIGADRHTNVKGNSTEKISQKSDVNVGADLSEKVGGDYSLQIGNDHGVKVSQSYSMDAGMNVYIKAGMNLVIEAGMSLCLKAAGGFIMIGPSGVAISGTMVLINSGGAATSGSPANIKNPEDPKDPDVADDGSYGGAAPQ